MTSRQTFIRPAAIALLLTVLIPLTIGSANACPEITMDPVTGTPTTQLDLQAALEALTEPVTFADASR